MHVYTQLLIGGTDCFQPNFSSYVHVHVPYIGTSLSTSTVTHIAATATTGSLVKTTESSQDGLSK